MPLPKSGRALLKAVGDAFLLLSALSAALAVAADFQWRPQDSVAFGLAAPPALGLFYGLMLWRRAYRVSSRYIGLFDFLNLVFVCIGTAIGVGVLQQVLHDGQIPVTVPLIFGFFLTALICGGRVLLRLNSWGLGPFRFVPGQDKVVRTLIVGAGDAGEMMIREIQKDPRNRRVVNGFVDDDPDKRMLIIQGVRVLGNTGEIKSLVEKLNIEEVILAIPSASGDAMRRIVQLCGETSARVRTLPSVSKLLDGQPGLTHRLRDIEIEDLLRREPAKVDPMVLAKYVAGESVLITGGGGSIGSELARQIAGLHPGHLVILGKGENSIYEIEQELLQTTPFVPSPVVADVRDSQAMLRAFEKFMPSVVYHAAAHKHVPLMQASPIEAILNNVFGTLETAECAIKFGAKRFVYISTDKAVNPTSVMGATKRVGEMIVTALAQRSETSFSVVRFGNVLGSRGSLIPLLKGQIARGGPVSITHPEMTRYFMTIPEAVQLILQAGSSGSTGELFILDMGEPVRILDLAEDLISLHGLTPGKDIAIRFIGIRPGEKTHEELVYAQEELVPTAHPKIGMAKSSIVDWDWLKGELATLKGLCDSGKSEAAQQFLMELAGGRIGFGVVQLPESSVEVSDR